MTVLTGNYPVGANSRFISPAITVPAANQYPRLRFWQYYSFFSGDCGADYGVVEVRVGTNAWQAVSPQYVNNAGSWSEPSIDLTAYAGPDHSGGLPYRICQLRQRHRRGGMWMTWPW